MTHVHEMERVLKETKTVVGYRPSLRDHLSSKFLFRKCPLFECYRPRTSKPRCPGRTTRLQERCRFGERSRERGKSCRGRTIKGSYFSTTQDSRSRQYACKHAMFVHLPGLISNTQYEVGTRMVLEAILLSLGDIISILRPNDDVAIIPEMKIKDAAFETDSYRVLLGGSIDYGVVEYEKDPYNENAGTSDNLHLLPHMIPWLIALRTFRAPRRSRQRGRGFCLPSCIWIHLFGLSQSSPSFIRGTGCARPKSGHHCYDDSVQLKVRFSLSHTALVTFKS